MINTLLGMVIDTDTMRPLLGGITGGLSGPAIRPVAVRCVWQVHARCPRCRSSAWAASAPARTPSSSCSPGASAVSVGTAIFNDPHAPARVSASCATCSRRGFARLADAVGHAHRCSPTRRRTIGRERAPDDPHRRRSRTDAQTAPRSRSPWTPPDLDDRPSRWAAAAGAARRAS